MIQLKEKACQTEKKKTIASFQNEHVKYKNRKFESKRKEKDIIQALTKRW